MGGVSTDFMAASGLALSGLWTAHSLRGYTDGGVVDGMSAVSVVAWYGRWMDCLQIFVCCEAMGW